MTELPSGVVTFLFTDVVGSTRLWADHHDAMAADLAVHDGIIRGAIGGGGGYVFSTGGDGFVAAFTRPGDAVGAAIQMQQELGAIDWSVPHGIRVRVGIHTGAANERGGDYFGPVVNETARLMSAAHGGQIVLSARSRDIVPEVKALSLGSHRLRDVREPVEVFQILADGLGECFPPLRTLGTGLSTLPEHRSSFIGRRDEIDRVRSRLAASRLVTLTGVGGVGKTRLAVEAAAEELPAHPGGVFFVDLATVDDPNALVAAVMAGIGLTPRDPEGQRAGLLEFLVDRTVLLVVDNCEHLLDPTADVVDDLLQHAPQLRVLATSREALDVEGEVVIRVPSLDPERAAVRLFIDRAMAVNDQFDPGADHGAVAELCARLDGIPLAIELAATATLTLSPRELLSGIDDRLALLRGGRRRGALGRQGTLEATIDWSHDLLDEDERLVFRRLGIFAGPFVFDLVPGVVDLPVPRARVVLERLVAKSMVLPVRIDQDRTGFRLLETLRLYAVQKLAEAAELDGGRGRLADSLLRWIDNAWLEAVRNDWTFWRSFRAQIPDVWRVADDLGEAGRISDLAVLLSVGINGTGDPGWDEERLRCLERIDREHLNGLEPPVGADVVGSLALALMNAGRGAEYMQRVATGWIEFQPLGLVEKQVLLYAQLVTMSLVDPAQGIRHADDALVALGSSDLEQVYRHWVLYLKSMCVASLRDFEGALRLAEQSYVPQDSELRDSALTTSLWFAHLARSAADPGRLAEARSVDPADGYWRPSVRIAAAMHLGDENATAKELVAIAEQALNGLLPGEEAEYLVAFARLAHLRGDAGRSRELLEATALRSPWTGLVMAEILRSVDNWPSEEWSSRFVGLILDRSSPERFGANLQAGRARLLEELSHWR